MALQRRHDDDQTQIGRSAADPLANHSRSDVEDLPIGDGHVHVGGDQQPILFRVRYPLQVRHLVNLHLLHQKFPSLAATFGGIDGLIDALQWAITM